MNVRGMAQTLTITLAAFVSSMVLFGLFMMAYTGLFTPKMVSPGDLFYWMFVGAFGTKFSWLNSLSKAAPLILTALCTALPARLGLVVIGAEGALLMGGISAITVGLLLQNTVPLLGLHVLMAVAAMVAGGVSIALIGALNHGRGVNATISSLLATYIIIGVFTYLVEGPLRDPASLNKPSTFPLEKEMMMGNMPGLDLHWGLALGVMFCLFSYILMDHTVFGFAARMAGGNMRAAQGSGLPVGWLIVITCAIGGAAAGLAGMVEIAAVHGQANASLIAGYGFTGILVSFIARHHPLGIIPAAVLFGGLTASSGVLQRRLSLPDASVQVFMGIIFVMILFFETLYGRFRVFLPKDVREAMAR